jgi:hypothetical protein
MGRKVGFAIVAVAVFSIGCRGSCVTYEGGEPRCWDDQTEAECTAAGEDYNYYSSSCSDLGYTAQSGDPGGSGATGCGTDPYGSCNSVWLGSPDDQAMYNCMAACSEEAACNEPGVQANCDILSAYGSDSYNNCTTCTGSQGSPSEDADETCHRQCYSDSSCNDGQCCIDTYEAGEVCLPCSCGGCFTSDLACSYDLNSCDFLQCY